MGSPCTETWEDSSPGMVSSAIWDDFNDWEQWEVCDFSQALYAVVLDYEQCTAV